MILLAAFLLLLDFLLSLNPTGIALGPISLEAFVLEKFGVGSAKRVLFDKSLFNSGKFVEVLSVLYLLGTRFLFFLSILYPYFL